MLLASIFVLLAIALLVGPIMMLRPSPRQAEISKLRALAAARGLRVRLLELPATRREAASEQVRGKRVAAYTRQLNITEESPLGTLSWCLLRRAFEHDIHLAGVWEWSAKPKKAPLADEPLVAFLQQLPGSVLGLRQDGKVIGLLWSEVLVPGQTAQQAFDEIDGHLQGLEELLLGAS